MLVREARRYTSSACAAFAATKMQRDLERFGDIPEAIINAPVVTKSKHEVSRNQQIRKQREEEEAMETEARKKRAERQLDPRVIAAREAAAAREALLRERRERAESSNAMPTGSPHTHQHSAVPSRGVKRQPLRCGAVSGVVDMFALEHLQACLKRLGVAAALETKVSEREAWEAPVATLQETHEADVTWIIIDPQPLYKARCFFNLPLSALRSCLTLSSSLTDQTMRKDAYFAELALNIVQPSIFLRKLLSNHGGSVEQMIQSSEVAKGCIPCQSLGFARTSAEAEYVAAMHAQRLLDSLGICVHSLAPAQRRYAETARREGRWAPFPPDHPKYREALLTIATNARDRKGQARALPLVLTPAFASKPFTGSTHSSLDHLLSAGSAKLPEADKSICVSGAGALQVARAVNDTFSLRALPSLFCIAQTLFFENRCLVPPVSYENIIRHLPSACRAVAPRGYESGSTPLRSGKPRSFNAVPAESYEQLLSEAANFGSGFDCDWRQLLSQLRGYAERDRIISDSERWMDDSEGGAYQITDFGPPPYASHDQPALLSPHSSSDAEQSLARVRRFFVYHHAKSISVSKLWEDSIVIEVHSPADGYVITRSKFATTSFKCSVQLPGIPRWDTKTSLPKGHSHDGPVAKLLAANSPRVGQNWSQYRDDLWAIGVGNTKETAELLCAMHAELMIDYYGGLLCKTDVSASDDHKEQAAHAQCAISKGRCALEREVTAKKPPRWIMSGVRSPLPLRQLTHRTRSNSKRLAPRSFEERFLGHHHHIFGDHNAHVLDIMPTDATDSLVDDLVEWMRDPLGAANPPMPQQRAQVTKMQGAIAAMTNGVTPGIFTKITDYFPSMQHDVKYRTSVLLPFLPSVYGLRGGICLTKSAMDGRRCAAHVAVETLCRLGQPLYPQDEAKQLAFEKCRQKEGRYVAPRDPETGVILPLPPSARSAPLCRSSASGDSVLVSAQQNAYILSSDQAAGGDPPLVRDYPPHNDLTFAVGLDLNRFSPREDVSDDVVNSGRSTSDEHCECVK